MMYIYKKNNTVALLIISIVLIIVMGKVVSNEVMNETNNITYMYIYYFAYIFIDQKITVINVLLATIPTIINISIFTSYMEDEINNNGKYIFTRTKRRDSWFINQLFKIGKGLLFLNLMQFLIAFLYFKFLGYKNINLEIVIKLYLLVVLNQFLIILISNILSLILSNIYGFMSSITLYFISIILMHKIFFENQNLVKYIPFIQNAISIHSNIECNRNITILNNYIENHEIYQSIIYVVILIIIFSILGIKIIRKKEIF